MDRPNRVLIVEDELLLRSSLARYFRSKGLDVSEAGTLHEARKQLAEGGFDAVLLDVGLPDGDGLSLLATAGADRSLVITANPDPARFASKGVMHHLPKPLDLPQVMTALRELTLEPAPTA